MTDKLPPNLLALFAPRPPLRYLPHCDYEPSKRCTMPISGVAAFLEEFRKPDPDYVPTESWLQKRDRLQLEKKEQQERKIKEGLEDYKPESDAQIRGDPYRTLFVARLNYDVKEPDLEREFGRFGPIERIRIVRDKSTNKHRGYAFIVYEREKDMKAAYKETDGIRIKDRRVLVDVERGRTVKGWKPRRLGGGLGGRGYTKVPVARPAGPAAGGFGGGDRFGGGSRGGGFRGGFRGGRGGGGFSGANRFEQGGGGRGPRGGIGYQGGGGFGGGDRFGGGSRGGGFRGGFRGGRGGGGFSGANRFEQGGGGRGPRGGIGYQGGGGFGGGDRNGGFGASGEGMPNAPTGPGGRRGGGGHQGGGGFGGGDRGGFGDRDRGGHGGYGDRDRGDRRGGYDRDSGHRGDRYGDRDGDRDRGGRYGGSHREDRDDHGSGGYQRKRPHDDGGHGGGDRHRRRY